MHVSPARIALLTGVSVSALGLACPALAATTTAPGVSHSVADTNVSDTLDISLVGDAGVKSVNNPAVAVVNSPATGSIVQQAAATGIAPPDGDVDALITNTGAAHVGATATASNAAGDATAFAQIFNPGLEQLGSGPGSLALAIDNQGALGIAAVANATADGIAKATASMSGTGGFGFAIYQSAYGGTAGATAIDASITNGASAAMSVLASANANGATATANANMELGIFQIGSKADTIAVSLTNDGALDLGVGANAVATVGGAAANATMFGGIAQVAFTADTATADLANAGSIDIAANAAATGPANATANASMSLGIGQSVLAASGAATLSNGTAGTINISANASANGGTAALANAVIGSALGSNAGIAQVVNATGAASVSLSNSGTINIAENANAVAASGGAVAHANVASAAASTQFAIQQSANGATAHASATNSGSISAGAIAVASGTGAATAFAQQGGLTQTAAGTIASANFSNAGTFAVAASASANGSRAGAELGAQGVVQRANGATATITADNSGSITVNGTAVANGALSAGALGVAGNGLVQRITTAGLATETLTNSGNASVAAVASAVAASGPANAHAVGYFALEQAIFAATTASQAMTNSGVASVVGSALASGAGAASATGHGYTAMFQTAVAGSANQAMTNSGSALASAKATAIANGSTTAGGAHVGAAFASASAYGIGQRVSAGTGVQSMVNDGVVDVGVHALASGVTAASADARATGAFQVAPTAVTQTFANDGSINVDVSAVAAAIPFTTGTGTTASTITSAAGNAHASAYGYYGFSFGGGTMAASVTNSGDISVTAAAAAPGFASASANGIVVSNATAGGLGSPLTGTLDNSGSVNVVASAAGGVTTTSHMTATTGGGSTTVTVTNPQSSAHAVGIALNGGVNTMTVTNSGTINVDAITANGGDAKATGVLVTANGAVAPVAGDVFTFTNDGGTIRVRESGDGGATWTRGMAIDVSASPNPSVINLVGDGNIYGNIDVNAGDTINVADGTTRFDGIINPEFLPAGGVTSATLDSGLFGEGTLNINAGGNFYLADPRVTGDPTMYDGAAYAFIDTLNMDPDGTLTFDLEPTSGGDQAPGTYPQVFADTANLAGTLLADVHPAGGLFADSYFWDNVIDANTLNGTFDQCALSGAYGSSPLLDFSGCIYDTGNNVDLGLTRVAFNAAGLGLTRNELAVATAIENVYDPGLTGSFANVLGQLFTLDQGNLAAAYDQMSGVEYPNYLHDVRNSQFVLNTFVNDQLDCSVEFGNGIQGCRDPRSGWRVWGMGAFDHGKLDSNANAIGYKADNWSGQLGVDYLAGNFSVGIFGGYRDLTVDFPDALVGSRAKANGWNVGLDATYDVGNFYVRGIGSFSWLNGDSRRDFHIGTLSGSASGHPDVDVLSFYGEAGARFDLGSSWVTPYVALDYTDMHLKAFEETGGIGANLGFDSQHENQTSGVIGLKWTGNLGGIVPEAKVAYRYDFKRDLGVDAYFVDAPAGADFRKVEDYKRGSILAGLSLAGTMGSNVTGRIGYLGEFNSDYTNHAVYGSLALHFGGPAAPPPPPPPAPAPPPPPPPPATQTCADGTVILATDTCPVPPPPPPPPAPAPERGM